MRIYKTKYYHIATLSGKLLTVDPDGLVSVAESDPAKAQLWEFVPTGSAYRVCNLDTGKVLDIIAGGTVNGAWVHVWEPVETDSQLWIAEIEREHMRLRSVSSGKYLDVTLSDNTHTQIWEKAGENQLWLLEVVQTEAPKPAKSRSSALKEREPSALKKKDPSALKKKDPSALKKKDPSALKKKDPSALKKKDPAAIKHREAAPIQQAQKPAASGKKKNANPQ